MKERDDGVLTSLASRLNRIPNPMSATNDAEKSEESAFNSEQGREFDNDALSPLANRLNCIPEPKSATNDAEVTAEVTKDNHSETTSSDVTSTTSNRRSITDERRSRGEEAIRAYEAAQIRIAREDFVSKREIKRKNQAQLLIGFGVFVMYAVLSIIFSILFFVTIAGQNWQLPVSFGIVALIALVFVIFRWNMPLYGEGTRIPTGS